MNHLNPQTRALLDRARGEITPSSDDLLRVRTRLKATLAATPTARALVTPVLALKLLGALALALGSVWALQRASAPPPAPPPPVAAEATICPPPAPPSVLPPPPAAPACPAVPTCRAPARAPSPAPVVAPESRPTPSSRETSDMFSMPVAPGNEGLEVGLLSDARIALDEGRPIGALEHVRHHRQLFSNSMFEEERLALEVLSYCTLGRRDLAAQPLERLLELAPDSTYLPRVRGTCGELESPAPEGEAGP